MKVLVVTQYFWPENFRVNDLVTHLCESGHEVTVLTAEPNYPVGRIFPEYAKDPGAFSRYGSADIVRVPVVPRGKGSLQLVMNYFSFAALACILAPWKLRRTSFDVIFVNQLSPVLVALPGLMMRILRRKPMAMWIQDLWPDTLDAVGVTKGGLGFRLMGALTSFIYRHCDLILTQSRRFVPLVRERAKRDVPVLYLPNWAGPASSETQPPAPEIPYRPDLLTILFAGNVGAAQDFPTILEAASALRHREDIRWIVVGDGSMSDWLDEEIQKRGLSEKMLTPGRFPVERMPSFFAHADALLVSLQDRPIYSMTVPSKVPSYMQAGLPLLCMVGGEATDIVRTAGAGLVVRPGDGAGLARAVEELASLSLAERQRMGANARRYAAEEFDASRLNARLQNHLALLIEGRKPSDT